MAIAFFTLHLPLFLNEDSLNAGADASEDFVRDGADGIAEDTDREVVAKDGDVVACLTVDTRDINHAHIHADVAQVRCFLTVDKAVAVAVAKTTVEPVGITDRDGCHAGWMIDKGFATVANGIACWHFARLEDGGFQSCHVVEQVVVARIYAIETESETNHIEMVLREMLDACRVADVADNLVTISCLEVLRGLVEELELLFAEGIELVVVASHEM